MNNLARHHILPLMTPGTESTITSTRIKMPNIGSEGLDLSVHRFINSQQKLKNDSFQ